MSEETVKLFTGAIDAWNRCDRDAFLAPMHLEAEWESEIMKQTEGADRVYRGRDGLERYWDEWHATWDLHIEVNEIRDLGPSLLVFAEARVKGHRSGVELAGPVAYLCEFEDGLIRKATSYLRPEEALEAAGLTE